jgi:dTDP-4-amino-4,6-dideoxy-D-galactose acyltransferase
MDATGGESFQELAWDSDHFGLKIGRTTSCSADTPQRAADWALARDLDCVYLLADARDAETLRSAAVAGFRMVDIRVTLSADVARADDEAGIRVAVAGDVPRLSRLAARSHRNSRFYADGKFPADRCDALFAVWMERSCTDRDFAGVVFVADVGGEPVAYITCAITLGVGGIGLIAVDESHRGRGLGGLLLKQAHAWFRGQGASRVQVVTQGANTTALRMYERAGFYVERVQLWFHWWRPEPDRAE